MDSLEEVVTGGYCIGCGACNCASDGVFPIAMNEYGMYQADAASGATLSDEVLRKALYTCPFSNDGPNEDVIGRRLFGDTCQHDSRIGYYKNLYIGHVAEGGFRAKGSSGGVITWVLTELLKRENIDAVAHVKKADNPDEGILFRYGISRTAEEVMAGSKSRYYPVEMSHVLEQIKQTSGRYAVVGLPCFIKAVRRLAEVDPVLEERVVFCIGLVCGHLKSKAFADCFGWQAGISPGQLEEIDFRVNLPGRRTREYGIYMRGAGKQVTKPAREFVGANWGYNFFRYPACDFCDDVFAETSDAVIGDAWLPEYEKDPEGNSVIVVRNATIEALISDAKKSDRLSFSPSTSDHIAGSQAGGLRDRREGLAYRLYLQQQQKLWVPCKRVKPSKTGISWRRSKIYKIRSETGAASHFIWRKALECGDYQIFESGITVYLRKARRLYGSLARRFVSAISRRVIALLKRSGNEDS